MRIERVMQIVGVTVRCMPGAGATAVRWPFRVRAAPPVAPAPRPGPAQRGVWVLGGGGAGGGGGAVGGAARRPGAPPPPALTRTNSGLDPVPDLYRACTAFGPKSVRT